MEAKLVETAYFAALLLASATRSLRRDSKASSLAIKRRSQLARQESKESLMIKRESLDSGGGHQILQIVRMSMLPKTTPIC